MNKLDEAREIINSCDKEIIELFKKRMSASKMVALYKYENNIDVLDSKREDIIVEKNIKLLNDANLEEYYLEVFKSILKTSKDYQRKIIEEMNK